MDFPSWYSRWLFTALGLQEGDEASPELLEPLFELNRRWLSEDYDHQAYAWDEAATARSYALFYMSSNIPKIRQVLQRASAFPWTQLNSVSDYGCGPGTMLWGLLMHLAEHQPQVLARWRRVHGVDSSAANLAIARRLAADLRRRPEFAHLEFEFTIGDWRQIAPQDDAHFAMFGNTLIESPVEAEFLHKLGARAILLLEPGTSRHFARLRLLRDQLALTHGWRISFPCTSSAAACPLSPQDWCHFHVNRFQLPFLQRMAAKAGRLNHRHHYSAFLFHRLAEEPHAAGLWRCLGAPRRVSRSVVRRLCNGVSLPELVLNRRDKTPLNQDFGEADSGSLLQIQGPKLRDRLTAAHRVQNQDS